MGVHLDKFYNILGYNFNNPGLIERALRHRSIGKSSNERLEFLGDAVLNFVVAAELFHRYPDLKEGALSRLRSNLVNGEKLAEISQELQVGDFLQFGSGELRSGGGKRQSILADAMEAIIGAIYLDGGFEAAQKRILCWYAKHLEQAAGVAKKDPKTRLQELLQINKIPLPIYSVVSTVGAAHAQIFNLECKVVGFNKTTIGSGPNKRRAEQDAAEKMLGLIEGTLPVKEV